MGLVAGKPIDVLGKLMRLLLPLLLHLLLLLRLVMPLQMLLRLGISLLANLFYVGRLLASEIANAIALSEVRKRLSRGLL